MSGYGGYNNDYSSYTGGVGGGGGGGWMTGTQVGSQASQASPGSSSKDRTHTNTLRPVTIKQLLEAHASPHKDGEWKIDDQDLGHVTFCGQIRSISEQATMCIYRLDDGTGTIEVRSWVDPEAPTAHEPRAKPKENMYVRVLGTLRNTMNSPRRYVAAANAVRPVEFNEVMYHALEATAVHLQITRKEQFMSVGAGTGDVQMSGMGNNTTGAQSVGSYNTRPGRGNVAGNPAYAHLSPATRKMMEFLSTVDGEGVHINVIAQKTGLSINEVYQGREDLIANSFVFYTIDDDTLAPMNF